MADVFHYSESKPAHPALGHAVLNNPAPGSSPWKLPDGSAAKVVVLGEALHDGGDAMQQKRRGGGESGRGGGLPATIAGSFCTLRARPGATAACSRHV